jgi:RNA recognition motif-containing protein
MNQNRLFVGNLSYQTADTDLQDYFSQAGAVTSVNVMFDKMTGKSRGFAFIEFATPEEANKAVEEFHNKDFQGRALTVNIARPREERGGGGGGQRWGNGRGNGEGRRERR